MVGTFVRAFGHLKGDITESGSVCSSRTRWLPCSRRPASRCGFASATTMWRAGAGLGPHHSSGAGGMTPRIVATPIASTIELPSLREGSFDPALGEALVPSSAREQALARLREPGAIAVTTGQQPGLFTGPLYTVYKALSTAALARVLERQWQRPVVPVFWVAGDDHDFAEASQASWIASDGALRTGALPPRPPDAPLTPMYRRLLGPDIESVLETLAADISTAELRDWTLAWLRRHYQPAVTASHALGGCPSRPH